ncbi:MAG TPA: hypothetical protein VGQ83_43035, partial [Polyangia bacterium]
MTELPDLAPYALAQREKEALLLPGLNALTALHRERCAPYGRFVAGAALPFARLEDAPYLPVTMFKAYELRSVADDELARVVLSSATTSGVSSRIYVDKDTADLQRISVHRILADFLGPEPRPYVVFDDRKTAAGRGSLSARGAALMALMPHASKFFFVMKDEGGHLGLDRPRLEQALDHAAGAGAVLAYGFTTILYAAHRELADEGLSLGRGFDPARSFILHSGGWKRLQAQAVDKPTLGRLVGGVWGLPPANVVDFYGLAEHVGVIYPDCPYGRKHVPFFAEVIVRDPATLAPAERGRPGLLQLLSLLGRGGPSHSIITEDLARIVAEDDCPCGRKGKAFELLGRAA